MILFILFICLTIEVVITAYIFNFDFLSPSVIFDGVFLLATIDLMIMKDYWEVSLKFITMIIIIIGTISFTLSTVIASKIRPWKTILKPISELSCKERKLKINEELLLVFILLYICLILGIMTVVTHREGLTLSFTNYVIAITNNSDLSLPIFLTFLNIICINCGYVWGYLIAFSWSIQKKVNRLLIILFAETLLLSIAAGKRGTAISLIICLFLCLILAFTKNRTRKIPRKLYIIITMLMFIAILSFQQIATSMGRDSDLFDPFEYFSIYLGAPIMNLDTSIIKGNFLHPVPLSETFHSLYNSFGENFKIQFLIYKTDRSFLSSPNGLRTGNVDTTFYDFYHDAGIFGVILFSAIMGAFSQILYNKLKRRKPENDMFLTLLYTYVLWLVARSFFANSLFDWFTPSTLYTLIVWWLASKIFTKKINNEGIYNYKK